MNPIDYWYKKYMALKETERIPKPELTWEDIAKIDALILEANNEFAVDYSKEISREQFYTEVLNRFNKSKEEK